MAGREGKELLLLLPQRKNPIVGGEGGEREDCCCCSMELCPNFGCHVLITDRAVPEPFENKEVVLTPQNSKNCFPKSHKKISIAVKKCPMGTTQNCLGGASKEIIIL
ncbi:hypothetical protein CEXT_52981 [Caerostris extrusa]|uniref:Uncharacterized protein n=1 Tax=Caerostris extrusa TaxID=172846 RepID=A0AAV4NYK2_CAEEX|nr:hypothetical protein CEXT_52981 [Caerostris extrusa]